MTKSILPEDTMCALDDILSESNPDQSRLNAFIKLKATRNASCSPKNLFGDYDMSFDVDVDLRKLPAKQKPDNKKKGCQIENVSNKTQETKGPRRSHSTSTAAIPLVMQNSKTQPEKSPGRRSHGPRRRVLEEEFENAANLTHKSLGPFIPKVSSTPASQKPLDKDPPQQKNSLTRNTPPVTSQETRNSLDRYLNLDSTFETSLKHMGCNGKLPSNQLKSTNTQQQPKDTSQDNFVKPKQLPLVKLKKMGETQSKLSSVASDTASALMSEPRVRIKRWLVQTENTIRARLNESKAAVQTTLAGSSRQGSASNMVELRQIDPEPDQGLGDTPLQDEVPVAGSTSPTVSIPEIINDESKSDEGQQEEETEDRKRKTDTGASPVNLAPIELNTIPQIRLEEPESSQEVLDLHCTRKNDMVEVNDPRPAETALNRPNLPAINGEQFAGELRWLSNKEILDLRKQNSLGRLHHQQPFTVEEQLVLEQNIQLEILHRNLTGQGKGLPSKVTTSSLKPEGTALIPAPIPTAGISDSSVTKLRPEGRGRARLRPRMTTELQNYISLSRTLKDRLKSSSKSNTKRNLYTKGNSDGEDNLPDAPVGRSFLASNSMQIAPAPPPHLRDNTVIKDLPIVPPPSASFRFSQQLRLQVEESIGDHESGNAPEDNVEELESGNAPEKTIGDREPGNAAEVSFEDQVSGDAPEDKSEDLESGNAPEDNIEELESGNTPEQTQSIPAQIAVGTGGKVLTEQAENAETDPRREDEVAAEQTENHQAERGEIAKQLAKPQAKTKTKHDVKAKKGESGELRKLQISLRFNSLPLDKNETEAIDTTGVRRSKRGHIPLQNTWVHSISNPFKSTFLERSINETYNKTKKKPRPNLKRKRSQLLESGISQLPDITEESHGATPPKRSRQKEPNRNRKRNSTESGRDAESLYSEREAEEMNNAEVPASQLELAVSENLGAQKTQLLHVMDCLRGIRQIPDMSDDSQTESTFFPLDVMRFSSATGMQFNNLEGIEYSFYDTEQTASIGFMRFQPLQQRGMKRNKTNTLRFIALFGEFLVEVENDPKVIQKCVLKQFDLVEILKGNRFNITNKSNEISLMIVNREP